MEEYSKYYEARNIITDILRKELIGPVEEEEILIDYMPIKSYSLGILYPQGISQIEGEIDREKQLQTDENASSDESENNDYEEDKEEEIKVENVNRQSSIGISFNLKENIEKLKVKIKYATYTKIKNEEKVEIEIDGKKEEKIYIKDAWKRIPKEVEKEINVKNKYTEEIEEGLKLQVNIYNIFSDKTKTVNVTLMNAKKVSNKGSMSEVCQKSFLQVGMEISNLGNSVCFIEKEITLDNILDKEYKKMKLLYKNNKNIAVGNGTGVMWNKEGEGANKIWTEPIPYCELNQMIARETSNKYCEINFLATASKEEVYEELIKIPKEYKEWLKEQLEDDTLTKDEKEIVISNIEDANKINERMIKTIELLKENEDAFKAFKFMNEAMLKQLERKTKKDKNEIKWRPFQIAFILLSLDGIIDKKDKNREIVDLLWFPTGGGKTEAYFGIIAFTIFFRRIIEKKEGRSGKGTTAIMRYTLRLLTLQQFERASTLICSCELIRRKNEEILGDEEISIGMWVGKLTKNYLAEQKKDIEDFIKGSRNNPLIVKKCPWCGEEIRYDQYGLENEKRIEITCGKCELEGPLPVYLVDEEIYNYRPTLLVSTADKYARLTWVEKANKLFGLDNKEEILPPELIIQDELHLIAGPLGTIYGLYETAIEALCTNKDIKPKIIASTATISNANEQIYSLYGRKSSVFPTQIKDIKNSFFAREGNKEEKPSREYLGLISSSVTPVTLLIRTYAALFYATRYLKEKGINEEIIDSFWTITGYFNSIKELGGASVQIKNDVKSRYNFLCTQKFKDICDKEKMHKYLFLTNEELTSRNADNSRISEILKNLEKNHENFAYDYILATNMISVGIDVDRLNTMIVDGQPKLNSEYIQATSRVGRKTPSLVIDLFNSSKSRDLSHYEQFVTYHSNIYKYVEATSVTPFSSMSREKALHAVLVILVRSLIPEMNSEAGARLIKEHREEIESLKKIILERVQKIDNLETEHVREELDYIIEEWENICDGEHLVYSKDWTKDGVLKRLLINAEETSEDAEGFSTLNTMRNVDMSSNIYLEE